MAGRARRGPRSRACGPCGRDAEWRKEPSAVGNVVRFGRARHRARHRAGTGGGIAEQRPRAGAAARGLGGKLGGRGVVTGLDGRARRAMETQRWGSTGHVCAPPIAAAACAGKSGRHVPRGPKLPPARRQCAVCGARCVTSVVGRSGGQAVRQSGSQAVGHGSQAVRRSAARLTITARGTRPLHAGCQTLNAGRVEAGGDGGGVLGHMGAPAVAPVQEPPAPVPPAGRVQAAS